MAGYKVVDGRGQGFVSSIQGYNTVCNAITHFVSGD